MSVVAKGSRRLISDIGATPFALCRDLKSKTSAQLTLGASGLGSTAI
jgi:hypothetical protein